MALTPHRGTLPRGIESCAAFGLIERGSVVYGSGGSEDEVAGGVTEQEERKPVTATSDAWRSGDCFGIVAIKYGSYTVRKSEVFLRYGLYGQPDAEIGMDYFFWVIADRDRVVLVDTGYAPAVGICRGRVNVGTPVEMLRALGVEPHSVSKIVLTHLHYDHIGNLREYPTADILLQRDEWDFWTGPYANRLQYSCLMEKDEMAVLIRAHEEGRICLLDGDSEIVPGVRTVLVGGHTPGQQIVIVEESGRRAVLASDSMHYYEQLERDLPLAVVSDVQGMYRGYDLLKELAGSPSTALIAGHDPRVEYLFPQTPTAGMQGVHRIW
jgi:glyoxylase-like metal-dependent hydrolase (beta-lactamase superfamily II)